MSKSERDQRYLAGLEEKDWIRITLHIPRSLERWYKSRAAKDRKADDIKHGRVEK